jgi:hypothetical protein
MEKLPELEYDFEAAREEIRRKHLESKPVSKKRKIDLGLELEKIGEEHKRERKKIDYQVDKKTRTQKETSKKNGNKEKSENKEIKKKEGENYREDKDNTGKKKKSFDITSPKHDKEMKIHDEPNQNVVVKPNKNSEKKIKS